MRYLSFIAIILLLFFVFIETVFADYNGGIIEGDTVELFNYNNPQMDNNLWNSTWNPPIWKSAVVSDSDVEFTDNGDGPYMEVDIDGNYITFTCVSEGNSGTYAYGYALRSLDYSHDINGVELVSNTFPSINSVDLDFSSNSLKWEVFDQNVFNSNGDKLLRTSDGTNQLILLLSFDTTSSVSKEISPSIPSKSDNLKANTNGNIGNSCNIGEASPGPFLVSNGDYFHTNTDFQIPALGLPLSVTRYYNSIDLYDGPFGHGWNMDYTARLVRMEEEDGTIHATVHMGNGVRRKFTQQPDGSYLPPAGQDDILVENLDGSFTFNGQCGTCSAKPRKAYEFNPDGALTAITDTNGNTLSIGYNPDGRIDTVTDANGRSITFSYGANGRVATVTDFDGRTWEYSYDASDNLTSVTDPLANTIQYQYDSSHNLTAVIDAKGQTVAAMTYDESDKLQSFSDNGGNYDISYDPVSRVTEKTNPAGGLFSFTYDDNGNITNKTGPQGKNLAITWDENVDVSAKVNGRNVRTAYTWDDDHNMTSVTRDADSLSLTTAYEYDSATGKVSRIIDPRGSITDMTYDDGGNLLTHQAPIGSSSYTYDGHGQLVQSEDPDGYVTAREYDANGYLTRVYLPGTSPIIETTFTYDARGNLLTRRDPNGNTTNYTYDLLDRLQSATDPLNNVTQFEYDPNGNLTRIIDAAGTYTNFTYDALDRVITRTDASNVPALTAQTHYTYDDRGNLLTVADPPSHVTTYTYDELSRVIRVEDHLRQAWTFAYDSSDNLVGKTDPNGNATGYTYDALNWLTGVTDAEGHTTTYSYDENGNPLTITDENSNLAAAHDYDANNRVIAARDGRNLETRMTYTDAGRLHTRTNADGEVATYAYEPFTGRLASITYASGRQEIFTYDPAGNLTAVSDSQTGVSVSFTYDALNRVASETQLGQTLSYTYDVSGNRDTLTLAGVGTYDYDFDALHRLTAITDPQGETTQFAYDAAGRRTQLTYGNGTYTVYSYDEVNRLLAIAHHRTDSTLIASYSYTYDGMNNRQTMTDHNSTITTYAYDTTYKLLSAITPDETVSFSYDGAGNRLSRNDSTGTINYAYDAANRLLDQFNPDGGSVAFIYDDTGRIATKTVTASDLSTETYSYTYDEKDQLIAVTSTSGIDNQYAYDPLGRRIRAVNSSGVRRFIYDGQNPLADITGDDATPVYSLIYTPALGLDVLASFNEGGQSRYYLRDGLNSVRMVLAVDESVVTEYDYQPYGEVKLQVGNTVSDFTFTGRRAEADTGLMYYRCRYYDPVVGRFLKKDSYTGQLNDSLSLHRYAYVKGNPVNLVDPEGKLGFSAFIGLPMDQYEASKLWSERYGQPVGFMEDPLDYAQERFAKFVFVETYSAVGLVPVFGEYRQWAMRKNNEMGDNPGSLEDLGMGIAIELLSFGLDNAIRGLEGDAIGFGTNKILGFLSSFQNTSGVGLSAESNIAYNINESICRQ